MQGRWSVRPLRDDDADEALAFLRRDAMMNVYLISRLLEEPGAAAQMTGVWRDGNIVALMTASTNIVLAAERSDPETLDTAIAMLADRILNRAIPVRAIISPADLVERLWRRVAAHVDPPTVVRMNQPVYVVRRQHGFPDLTRARYATSADLDRLVPACAAMHAEEVGIDPLARDAVGYRERIRELVDRRRAIVLMDGREIASKCEFSAVTDEAVQLMGVWTNPLFRRRGLAHDTLREVCGHIFRSGRSVTLFVNDFNTPAVRLYETLGFERIGINRALIW